MAKMNIWSSGAGIVALIFMVAGAVGAVLQFIDFYLPAFQLAPGDTKTLIAFILVIAAMAFCGIAIIVAIFGIPKLLWIIFAFLALACLLVPPIVYAFDPSNPFGFLYFNGLWYQFLQLDFIGFWVGAGGSLLALITGLFVPSD